MNYLFGLRFKVVGGYKAATETHIAMERGEVDGRCGISWDTLQALNADWLRDKKIRILIQIGIDRVADLPNERPILLIRSTPSFLSTNSGGESVPKMKRSAPTVSKAQRAAGG